MTTRIQVVFYSMYGHVYRLAEAVSEGAREVVGTEVSVYQVPELVPDDILEKTGAKAVLRYADALRQHVRADAQLPRPDGRIMDERGTRWQGGQRVHQHRNPAWRAGDDDHELRQHAPTPGMIIVGVPYSEPRLVAMTEITGGTPYGASTITAADGSRLPTENELAIARFQGRHVAEIAVRLTR
jgi:multimeric flavodoxin WrbA